MTKAVKLKVITYAKFQAFCASLLGLLAGFTYALGGLFIDLMVSFEVFSSIAYGTSGLSLGTILAFAALLGMPAIFACCGFVLGLIQALLYNQAITWFSTLTFQFWD